jgi:predicted metal-dependent peptidase
VCPAPLQTKLGAARTRLILEHPFIGALVMHLPLEPADPAWCATIATDVRALYYNPAYIAGLTLEQVQFVLAHEAMHCALAHFARRSHRARRRWDVACDHAVNWLLAEDGLETPPGALLQPGYRGLSAEEIYPLVPADTVETPLDRHLYGEIVVGEAAPPASAAARTESPGVLTAGVEAELARRWLGRLAFAGLQARRAGRLASSWLRLIDELIQPHLPWRQLLARYVMHMTRDDYSFQRPSRREGDALLPRLSSGEVDLHIVLDTSGSIRNDELAQFVAEVDALKGQVSARVTVHACDERLDSRGPWCFQPWEPLSLPRELGGGGGTRFGPVFDWLAGQGSRPDLLVYFTDAEGEFPRGAPGYPVVWLVKGPGRVPWGERIQLN